MKKKRITAVLLILASLALVFFSACKNIKNNQGFIVYYTNPAHDELVSKSYTPSSEDTLSLVRELFDKMKKAPDENSVSVIPENVILNAYYIENNVLNLDFSTGFNDMGNVDKALFKTAIVKTVLQIQSVEYVHFYIMGQPITDTNGIDIGLVGANSFITENEPYDESVYKIDTVLYFADSTGEKLVGEKREILYNQNSSIENLIVDNLIKGPNDSNNKRTLPSKLKVLSVSIKDGVCYVNFDSEILSSIADVSGKVTIYSVVNSLCELPSVRRVQFLVNGSTNYTLRETYSFKDTYERKLDIIKKE